MADAAGARWSAQVAAGDALPAVQEGPLSRLTLALYCGASGDHNPIHVDLDFARGAGYGDVFAHGMLSMAWLARVLTNWAPQTALREFGVRFAALTQVGEVIRCTGVVAEIAVREGERCARIELATRNAAGEVKLTGQAWVALP